MDYRFKEMSTYVLISFSLRQRDQIGSRTYPASYPMDTGGFFPGVKRSGREAHERPTSAEVKSESSYTSTHPHVMTRCLIKHK
jgi:hypothetical protein